MDFNTLVDELDIREGTTGGDNVTATPTSFFGVTAAAAKAVGEPFDVNMDKSVARGISTKYVNYLDGILSNTMEGYTGSSDKLKRAILDTAYNVGESVASWPKLSGAVNDPSLTDTQKITHILDAVKAEGVVTQGIANRRAEMYNQVSDVDIADVRVNGNTVDYLDASGNSLFKYDEAATVAKDPVIKNKANNIPIPVQGQQAVLPSNLASVASYDYVQSFDVPDKPSFIDTTTAVMRRHSVITNALYNEPTSLGEWHPDESWNEGAVTAAYNEAVESGIQPYLLEDAVSGSRNSEHWDAYVTNARTQQQAMDVLDRSSGLSAIPAYVLNEAANPINWVGFGVRGVTALKTTADSAAAITKMGRARAALGMTAAPTTAELGVAVTTSELLLKEMQGDARDWSDVMLNIGATTIFGGLVNGATTKLHARSLAGRLQKEVDEVTEWSANGYASTAPLKSSLEHNMEVMEQSSQAMAASTGVTAEEARKTIRADIASRYNLPNDAQTIEYIHAAEAQSADIGKRIDAIKSGLGSNVWIAKQSDFMKLIDSDSIVVQKAALDMFESPVGYGGVAGQTSMANRFVQYTDDLTSKFVPIYDTSLKQYAKSKGAGSYVAHRTYSNDIREEFDSLVSDEMARRYSNSKFGKTSATTDNAFVKAAADAHDAMTNNALQRLIASGASGMDEIDWHSGWMSMKTDLNKVNKFLLNDQAGKIVENSIYKNLRNNADWNIDDALIGTRRDPYRIIAKAYSERMMTRSSNVDNAAMERMIGDVDTDKLRTRLADSGLDEAEIEGILDGVTLTKSSALGRGNAAIETKQRGKVGEDTGTTLKRNTNRGANRRLPIDPFERNDGFALMDILDNRLQTVAEKYAHNTAGISVKAERGFRTGEEFDTMIESAIASDRSTGREYRAKVMRAANDMFSSRPVGGENSKILQGVLDYSSARSLGGTGLASVVELANVFGAHQGRAILELKPFRSFTKMFNPKSAEGQAMIQTHLEELREFGMGALAREHKVHMPNVRLELGDGAQQGMAMTSLANAQRALYKYSGNNMIRAAAHEMTVGAMATDLVKMANGAGGARWLTPARIADLGWSPTMLKNILKESKKHHTRNADGTSTLGLGKWKPETLQAYKDGLSIHVNSLTQRAFAGEEILAFKSPTMRLLFQFMQYPMTALGKQFGKSLNQRDTQAFMQLVWGLGLSMMQHHARTYINSSKLPESERGAYIDDNLSMAKLANGTLSYMPQTPFFNLPYAALVDGMNYGQEGYRPLSRSPSDSVAAALGTLDAAGKAMTVPFDLMSGDLDRASDKIYNAMPLQSLPWLRPIYGLTKED